MGSTIRGGFFPFWRVVLIRRFNIEGGSVGFFRGIRMRYATENLLIACRIGRIEDESDPFLGKNYYLCTQKAR